METQIRTYMMYLDNLLKQLINYRMVKKERYNDDTKVIARKLISEVERVTQKIVDDV